MIDADGCRLTVQWHGETIVDVLPRTVAHEGPVYQRPFARPSWQDALQAAGPDDLPRPASGNELRATLLQMVAAPNLASNSWVTDQYDRYVRGNTVLAEPEDAGVVRVDEETGLGVAIATDGPGRFARLDPYAGAQLALAEAYRNVATTGARPLAVSDCLNFGSPEDPGVMWQFAEACRGLADACAGQLVARHGGEEFAVLTRGLSLAAATALLDRARETLSDRRFRDRETGEALGQITLSTGVVAVGPSGTDVSYDGGLSWVSVEKGSLDSVECTRDGACWGSGSDGRVAVLRGLR